MQSLDASSDVTAVASDEAGTAVKVVLGGEWFTSTTTGDANG